ncbi:MAG: phage tail tape measure protein, partial [Nitrosopumilus sp.]
MADKEFSIELTTANSERNAGRLLADLDSIAKEIRGVTEAAASMDLKSKKLTGTLSRLVGEGKKVTLAFKDTAEGLKLVGVNATDTSRKLAELARQQNIIDKQAAGSAKLNFLVQKGREIQLLKEKIALQAKEARFTRANAALEVGVKGGEKLTRLREEQALGNKLLRIDEARRRSQEKLIDAPARNVRAHNKALKEQAVALAKTERASSKARLAQERLTQSNNRAKNATTNLSISWSSLVRLLSAQVIYRAVFGLAAQLRQAFENAIELQVAIAELQTIAPPSESFSDFSEILREVSDAFGLDIIEATEAGYQALSNQVVDTAAEMEAFLTVMGKLAIATRSTLAEATNLTTGVLNAYRLEVGKANEVSAKLFKTIELGRVRAEEMANSLGNVAILANQVGLSMDELLGLIATLTVQGIRFSEAQTQIRGILIKLIKPTRDMTEFLTDLGFASGEAAIKSLGLIKFLALMSERTGDSTTEIAKLINRVRGLSGALAVTGKGFDLLNRNINEISKQSMPAFNRAINIVLDNQGKKFLIFQNQLKNFFTQDIGQEFVSTLSILVGGFENLIKVIKFTVEVIITALVPAISAAVFTLGKAFFTLSVPLSGFKLAMIALFVVGTAFVAVIRTLRTHTAQLADSINVMRKAARDVAEEFQKTLGKALDDITNKVLDLIDAINSAITAFAAGALTKLNESVRDIADLFDDIGDALSDSITAAGDKIKEVLNKFESGLSRAQTLVKKIADEFKRINLSVAQQVFEITFDAATPAEQTQLLIDKLIDLQAILGSGVNVDIFRKTQKEIEDIIVRQQKITQEALDVEEKSAIEAVKARAKAIEDIIKLEG